MGNPGETKNTLKPTEHVVYMLYGEDAGELRDVGGPFLGRPGLELSSLAIEFRAISYATHEAKGEDFCLLSHGDFISWLLEREILFPMNAVSLDISFDTSDENAYVPSHWPLCPECGVGRGREETGRVLHSLNRQEHYRQCMECRYIWGRNDQQWLLSGPMLEDDGRCIPSGCAPYSISQACGLPISQVLEACRVRGWREEEGLGEDQGIEVVRMFGHQMVPGHMRMIAGKLTLKKVLDVLVPTKNYIVATRGHWLAVVKGVNRDQSGTSLRTEVVGYWEVLQATQT